MIQSVMNSGFKALSAWLLFFSAVIPCILSTSIPVKVPQMLFIWVERVILSVLLAGAAALILF